MRAKPGRGWASTAATCKGKVQPKKGEKPFLVLNKDSSQNHFGLRYSICLDSSDKTTFLCAHVGTCLSRLRTRLHTNSSHGTRWTAGTSTGQQPSFASTLPLVRQPGPLQTLPVTSNSRNRKESPKYKNKHFVGLSGPKVPLLNSIGSS